MLPIWSYLNFLRSLNGVIQRVLHAAENRCNLDSIAASFTCDYVFRNQLRALIVQAKSLFPQLAPAYCLGPFVLLAYVLHAYSIDITCHAFQVLSRQLKNLLHQVHLVFCVKIDYAPSLSQILYRSSIPSVLYFEANLDFCLDVRGHFLTSSTVFRQRCMHASYHTIRSLKEPWINKTFFPLRTNINRLIQCAANQLHDCHSGTGLNVLDALLPYLPFQVSYCDAFLLKTWWFISSVSEYCVRLT